ncbi:GDSL-type esterase/lipase family protein [Blastococcus saxobsidens]|nr:GDSL-type esterase/lipase family protein [Blastococcus saxobsidens]
MRRLALERPPSWGILALVLLVLGNVALFTVMGMRPAPADTYESQAPAGAGSPVPAESPVTPAETEPSEPPVLAVYGDGYAAGNEMGGQGATGWPALVAQRTGTELALHAVPQAGYASIGVTGQDYMGLLGAAPVPDADITLLFGSRNDADEDPAQVKAQAVAAMAAAAQNAPQAILVVIGPVWDDGDAPASVLAVRDLVQAAAQGAGAVFVDPLADGWFGTGSGLIATDGISPTDAGHAYLAEQIAPVVTAALQ